MSDDISDIDAALREIFEVMRAHGLVGYLVVIDQWGKSCRAFQHEAPWSLITHTTTDNEFKIGVSKQGIDPTKIESMRATLLALLALNLRAKEVAEGTAAIAKSIREHFDVEVVRRDTQHKTLN